MVCIGLSRELQPNSTGRNAWVLVEGRRREGRGGGERLHALEGGGW